MNVQRQKEIESDEVNAPRRIPVDLSGRQPQPQLTNSTHLLDLQMVPELQGRMVCMQPISVGLLYKTHTPKLQTARNIYLQAKWGWAMNVCYSCNPYIRASQTRRSVRRRSLTICRWPCNRGCEQPTLPRTTKSPARDLGSRKPTSRPYPSGASPWTDISKGRARA